MRTYFVIDPRLPTPRGPGVFYECLRCGDILPSVEEARGPWSCRCKPPSIMLDFDMHRATFKDPANARGIRESPGPSPTPSG